MVCRTCMRSPRVLIRVRRAILYLRQVVYLVHDDVGLHLEFGRRVFFFTVQRNAISEVSAESARERVRTVTEGLMSSAELEEQRLPEAPRALDLELDKQPWTDY